MTYYLSGSINDIEKLHHAENWVAFGVPSVIRKWHDGTYTFFQLSKTPVQPGQTPFQIRDSDIKWNI